MKKLLIGAALTLALCGSPAYASADIDQEALQSIIQTYKPANTGYLNPKIEKIDIDQSKKTITIQCNESTAYIPFTAKQVAELKQKLQALLPSEYAKYKLQIKVLDNTLDRLASGSQRKVVGPKEKKRFITYEGGVKAPNGLDGRNIALWQSHGWYFEPKLNRWEWQRARIFQTVEDLYTQSYVMPFLMPMLQNAGAYVMSPRERDVRTTEIIIDNDIPASGYAERIGKMQWSNAKEPGFAYDGKPLTINVNPFKNGTVRCASSVKSHKDASTASWSASVPESGEYAVYVSYASLPNSATDAEYTIEADNGTHKVKVNQQMGGGTWIYLGHYPFDANAKVSLSNVSADKNAVVSADAVKIGGGMGNVARIVSEDSDSIDFKYKTSGYPRFTEGARYWLQWAGAPDSVYTPSGNVNDYTDDYRCRGTWVNWLAGGSSMLPNREGLNIPVDLSLAFHTDAGTTLNDSIIGTLGIYYSPANNGVYANGTDRLASRDYVDDVMTNITNDVRAAYEPNWTRRGMWDQSYFEARVPEVPAMLLELLSHQNFADMKYGLDPSFRFTVSRAIYKGMGEFLAKRDGKEFVVQPLPVNSFAIKGNNGKYSLTWKETVDTLESSATPAYYIVEERIGDAVGFSPIAQVSEPRYEVTVSDGDIHSYRIIAGNNGGVSFPSEVLALCDKPGKPQVLIVNGFTRVSAPDWFEAGEIAGFYDESDHGVPYIQDISFIGSQKEFRRSIPWMDDDASGFGDSRSDYEDKVIAGNTFDYPYVHGAAIAEAGYGFISSSADAFMATSAGEAPKMLDLILGKQKEIKIGTGAYGTKFKTYPSLMQQRLREYTQHGGSVFVSGSYIGTDLWDNPLSSKEVAEADKKFATEVLGYIWRVDKATVEGEAYEVESQFKAFNGGTFNFAVNLNPDVYAAESPDALYGVKGDASTIMRYADNNIPAGIAYDPGIYRTVAIGFPFETITKAEQRNRLMKQVLDFLSK